MVPPVPGSAGRGAGQPRLIATACAITSSTTRASRAADGPYKAATPTRPRRGKGTAIARSGWPRRLPATSRGSRRDLNVVLSHAVWRVFETRRRSTGGRWPRMRSWISRTRCGARSNCSRRWTSSPRAAICCRRAITTCSSMSSRTRAEAQWELVWRLVQAWGEGLGMEQDAPLAPSIFIVGDRKQSIYGFRDADVGVLARAASASRASDATAASGGRSARAFARCRALLAFTNDLFDAVEKHGAARRVRLRREGSLPGGRGGRCAANPVLGLVVATDAGAVCGARGRRDRQAADVRAGTGQATGLARAVRPGDIGDPLPVP